jgi:ABC-type nitrate/sulfonate/bicarbonate transport system substrate-binding protein
MSTEHTAAEVEGWVAKMRQEIAIAPPAPGDIRTPDQIIFQLERVDSVANHALWIVTQADKVREAAAEALLRAKAKAQQTVDGKNAEARAAAVNLATEHERAEEAAAQIAYRYAKGLADLVDSRKSSLQTQSKLVLGTMQMAGGPGRG